MESRQSFDAIPVKDYSEALHKGLGAFYFATNDNGVEFMTAIVPAADDKGTSMAICRIASEPHPCWAFNGDREKPTLSPSIYLKGHWHGFLRNGRFESC